MTTVRQHHHDLWYVDGVSCLGKTTFVDRTAGNYDGLKLDYAERTHRAPVFLQKSQSHIVQILYTATFGLEVLRRREQLCDGKTLFVDRSPISDIWYELLFKHFDDQAYQRRVFDWIEQLNVFELLPTIFVVPHESHAPAICRQMQRRSNNLDRMTVDYVLQQIQIFRSVVERFEEHPNVRVIRIEENQEIYSKTYFDWIAREFLRVSSN